MALSRLFYVRCDRCGTPAGSDEQMGDTVRQARVNAQSMGFVRTRDPNTGYVLDLCPGCTGADA